MEKTKIFNTRRNPKTRILIGTPTLGLVRFEWAAKRWGQVIPCNWEQATVPVKIPAPGLPSIGVIGLLTADAQNVIVQELVEKKFEWLFLHEDDVLLPIDMCMKLNEYMRKGDVPVVSGLYYTKSNPSEPIIYRGRGNSYYGDWKRGEKVWCDGVPTGCLLVHSSILLAVYEDSEPYTVTFPGLVKNVRRVFQAPREAWTDPESERYYTRVGTSDLYFCDTIVDGGYLKKAGWPKIARKRWPFLCDTRLFCKHVDLVSGQTYPE